MRKTLTLLATVVALQLGNLGGAQAQTAAPAGKTIAVEADAPFAVFSRWVNTVYIAPVDAPPVTRISFLRPATAAGAPYEPRAVILGLPDWPLMGDGAAQAAQQWGGNLNYQGLQMHLLVLDARTGKHQLRPIANGLRQGERFKLRIVSSFDAVADLDQVVGSDWRLQRTTRVYPAADSSVQLKAGRTLDLPVGTGEYFSFDGNPPNERIVVSVRHAKANDQVRSAQPVYRQDGSTGSSYLQLVPPGQYPAIEQLISLRR